MNTPPISIAVHSLFVLNDISLLLMQAGVFRSDPIVLLLNLCPQIRMLRFDLLNSASVGGWTGLRGKGWLGIPCGNLFEQKGVLGFSALDGDRVYGTIHCVDRHFRLCPPDYLEPSLLGSLIFDL